MSEASPKMNGETYFFRDSGQFDLLRLRILPELIERGRKTKTLRLWSAGCASGEEAYSLAILVDLLLPEHDDWNVMILGSDINQTALAKARRGRYGAWSFRMVPGAMQRRYFQNKERDWLLDERILRMVTLRTIDLINAPFPIGDLCDMDLILCRNVFIYFSADAVATVAEKLSATLGPNGYLMNGHTELIGLRVEGLRSRLFAEGVVQQRAIKTSVTPLALPPTMEPAALHPPSVNVATAITPSAPEPLAAARKLADSGEYSQAECICRQTLAADPLSAQPYFLLAQLAQLRGDFDRAHELLDKTLYLDPHCVAAYLELAALCERVENLSRARTLRRAAWDIVSALPGDMLIEPYETTAAEMGLWLTQEATDTIKLIP